MSGITYSISKDVFNRFPDFIRGVLVAGDVENRPSPDELIGLLRQAENDLREELMGQDLAAYPRIYSWREAFRSLGIKPSEFRSSIESMARRVMNGSELPSINALVDIGNIISLRHLIPVGGHALDHIKDEITQRPAYGDETFIPFGSQETEHPEPGEFIFTEGSMVLTRRWVWRQSNHTLTELDTRTVEFNLDGLPPVNYDLIEQAGNDLADLVNQFCGGSTVYQALSWENQRIMIDR